MEAELGSNGEDTRWIEPRHVIATVPAMTPAVRPPGADYGEVAHGTLNGVDYSVVIYHRGFLPRDGDCPPAHKSAAQKVVDCRRAHLMDEMHKSIAERSSIADAIEAAMDEVDAKLKPLLEGPFAADGADYLWRTVQNVCVVVVYQGFAYATGMAMALLTRDGKDLFICKRTPQSSSQLTLFYGGCSGLPLAEKCSKVQLSRLDTYLVVTTELVFMYIWHKDQFTTVFEQRVAAFGLVEACKDLIGYYKDSMRKVLIVLPLSTKQSLLPVIPAVQEEEVEEVCQVYSFQTNLPTEDEKYERMMAGVKDEWLDYQCLGTEPWQYFRPIVNGKRQFPTAITSANPELQTVEPEVECGKPMCAVCRMWMLFGTQLEHFKDVHRRGSDIVIPTLWESFAHKGSFGVTNVIHTSTNGM